MIEVDEMADDNIREYIELLINERIHIGTLNDEIRMENVIPYLSILPIMI